jgi:hypothetical protein
MENGYINIREGSLSIIGNLPKKIKSIELNKIRMEGPIDKKIKINIGKRKNLYLKNNL